jgi:predicted amidohydrolase YtcJ
MGHSQPDLILYNGVIHLLNPSVQVTEALAIYKDRFSSIGMNDEILALAGSETEVINLDGRCILPGMTDAHIHIEKFARNLSHVDCEVPSLQECLDEVRTAAEGKTDEIWLLGHGWNQNQWSRFGNQADLDTINSDIPIYLTAKSLHAGWANSKALQIAGIVKGTPDPPGGEIQLDSEGEPTGILFENAMRLVSQHIPSPSVDELAFHISNAQHHLWEVGITGIHDFDGIGAFSALQLLRNRGDLGLRVIKNIPVDYLPSALQVGLRSGFGDHWLRLGNIKLFSDGALGPHTAAMIEPFEGDSENTGMLLLDSEEIAEIGRKANKGGFGLSIHAIGDRANHIVLNALEMMQSLQTRSKNETIRHRIEHLQLLHPDDLHRVSKMGVVASMQPIHATSDMDMAQAHWGDRSRYSYAWRSVLDTGAILAFGSDAPVEDPNPFHGIHAAVTRKRIDGSPQPNGWIPEERIDLLEALTAYTYAPALAVGLEEDLGKISPGYLADLIVLDVNPFGLNKDQIFDLSPVGTMVGGEWRYRNF